MKQQQEKVKRARGRKNSVQAFMRRVLLILASLVALASIVVLLLVYLPLRTELKKSLVDNFYQLSLIRYTSLHSNMNRGLEGARSLSSRSVIRDAILRYEAGEIDMDALIAATQPKYEDGARALEYLIKAERFVDNIKISGYTSSNYKEHSCTTEERLVKGNETSYALCLTESHSYFVIISPMLLERRVIGYDKLVFDLSNQIRMLCTREICSRLVYQDELDVIVADAEFVQSGNNFSMFYKDSLYYISFSLKDGAYFLTTQSADTLLSPIHRLSKQTLSVAIGILLAFSAAIYVFIIRSATNELLHLEDSRRSLTQAVTEANIDPLTEVSGRRFGEKFLAAAFDSYQDGEPSPGIVLFDVDSLKQVNDTYGHATGDQVIRAIAKEVQRNIRSGDLLIRWGGDEFIGVFSGLKEKNALPFAQKLLTAVSSLAIESADGVIRPTISIGISCFREEDRDFLEAINRADRAMYESKAKGRNQAHKA